MWVAWIHSIKYTYADAHNQKYGCTGEAVLFLLDREEGRLLGGGGHKIVHRQNHALKFIRTHSRKIVATSLPALTPHTCTDAFAVYAHQPSHILTSTLALLNRQQLQRPAHKSTLGNAHTFSADVPKRVLKPLRLYARIPACLL